MAFLTLNGELESYVEMLRSPNIDGWKGAIGTEYGQLKDKQVFEWVDTLPEGKKAVGSHIVY